MLETGTRDGIFRMNNLTRVNNLFRSEVIKFRRKINFNFQAEKKGKKRKSSKLSYLRVFFELKIEYHTIYVGLKSFFKNNNNVFGEIFQKKKNSSLLKLQFQCVIVSYFTSIVLLLAVFITTPNDDTHSNDNQK